MQIEENQSYGRAPVAHPGTAAFARTFKPQRSLLVGGDGIALEEYFSRPARIGSGATYAPRLDTANPIGVPK